MTRTKGLMPILVAPAMAFALTACGGGDSKSQSTGASSAPPPASSQAAAAHNNQDVSFAQGMIPHHQQAIDMAKIAATRASMSEVKQLASDIEKAQGPEIQQLSGWLKAWGASVPSAGMGGMDMGSMGNGMMSNADMAKLKKLSGMAFDTAFLKGMIKHHEGAVTMAKAEVRSGQNPQAKVMAASIITSQTAEIAKMRLLLKKM